MKLRKTKKQCLKDNDFETAVARYNNTSKNFKNYWWDCVVQIYKKCKEFAKKYLLFPIERVVKSFKDLGKGLYLIYDIEVDEEKDKNIYWVKVGMTCSSFANRLRSYCTENPSFKVLALKSMEDDFEIMDTEEDCHRILESLAKRIAINTKEWFEVDKETFCKIKEEKFAFFGL
jgi:hypothetical protein